MIRLMFVARWFLIAMLGNFPSTVTIAKENYCIQ